MKNRYLVGGPITPLLISELMTLAMMMPAPGQSQYSSAGFATMRSGGKRVKAIEYSAYNDMADKEAEEIVKTVKAAFSDVRKVIIVHLHRPGQCRGSLVVHNGDIRPP